MDNYQTHRRSIMNKNIERFGEPKNLDELAEWCIKVINAQLKPAKNELWGFAWNIDYQSDVSNTHHCPIDGVTNWAGRTLLADGTPAPRGYPGFYGRVWVRTKTDKTKGAWMNDVVSSSATHTGTGGSGSYRGLWNHIIALYYQQAGHVKTHKGFHRPECYSWDYRFFLMDFPHIEQEAEQQKILCAIQNNHANVKIHHEFSWTHPDAIENDERFEQMVQEKSVDS